MSCPPMNGNSTLLRSIAPKIRPRVGIFRAISRKGSLPRPKLTNVASKPGSLACNTGIGTPNFMYRSITISRPGMAVHIARKNSGMLHVAIPTPGHVPRPCPSTVPSPAMPRNRCASPGFFSGTTISWARP